jgi:hypothetical protein
MSTCPPCHAMPALISSHLSVTATKCSLPFPPPCLPCLPSSFLLPPSSTSVADVNTTPTAADATATTLPRDEDATLSSSSSSSSSLSSSHLISSHLILIFIFHHHAVKHALTLPNEPPLPLPCWWSGERKSQPGINLLVWPRLVLRTCVACSPRAPAASMRPPLYSTVLYFTVRTYI